MYDEYFSDNKLIMDQRLLKSIKELFHIRDVCMLENLRFMPERLEVSPGKNLASLVEDFKTVDIPLTLTLTPRFISYLFGLDGLVVGIMSMLPHPCDPRPSSWM